MSNLHIHVIKTGGTIEFIDPAYDEINKQLLKLDASIDSYLKDIIKPHFTFSIEPLVAKDSRDLNKEDRQKLLQQISNCPHKHIVATHGTFTMQETARFLADSDMKDKVVVLTGSMIPIIGFPASDAGFNLGFVFASIESLDPGVYLSMNGGIFSFEEVQKNSDKLRFE